MEGWIKHNSFLERTHDLWEKGADIQLIIMPQDSVKYGKCYRHHRATEKEAIGFALEWWGTVMKDITVDLDLKFDRQKMEWIFLFKTRTTRLIVDFWCCVSHKESDTIERLNWTKLKSDLKGSSGSVVKNPPAMQETQVWHLGQENPLQKETATHSSILAWESPWTEESGELQFMGVQKSWIRFTD